MHEFDNEYTLEIPPIVAVDEKKYFPIGYPITNDKWVIVPELDGEEYILKTQGGKVCHSKLFSFGKLEWRSSSDLIGDRVINRVLLADSTSKITFLIDTGADISVIPKSFEPHAHVKHHKVIDINTKLSSNGQLPKIKSVASNLGILVGNTKFDKILKQYPELINPSQPINVDTSNQVYHHIETKGPQLQLKGHNFIIFIDHRPLTFTFNKIPDSCSPCQLRHLDFISQFSSDIGHVSGSDNSVADALSRINALNLSTTDLQHLADSQTKDEELKTLISSNDLSIKLKPLKMGDALEIFCDVSREKVLPYMPEELHFEVFRSLHNLSVQVFVPLSASSKTTSSGLPC
ncbi:uncharacterized protein NPIL_305161 [Nephila pilipes]|uniref:Peptidase A2 domain-containing protein n=1 Tax=Nephila pilipes TaxID=299642 RepID=A0A8X6NAT3_NEPPI|nr:uncharacterized protein NPIL_305161 [Nephila pilipes]